MDGLPRPAAHAAGGVLVTLAAAQFLWRSTDPAGRRRARGEQLRAGAATACLRPRGRRGCDRGRGGTDPRRAGDHVRVTALGVRRRGPRGRGHPGAGAPA